MIVLGVETSGPVGSLALRRDGRCLEERFLPELGRRHAQSLLPEVVALLKRHDLTPASVAAVAVSIGPGSFTGLRVGVTFAKVFAYATGAPLAAVETFLAVASNLPSASSVVVLADAQRGGLMRGDFIREPGGRFLLRRPVRLVSVEDATEGDEQALLTGPGVERLQASQLARREVAPLPWRYPRAAVVASLGEDQVRRGESADPWGLEPLYVRKSAAEEKREALESEASKQ